MNQKRNGSRSKICGTLSGFFKTLETKLQLDGKYLLGIPNYYIYYKLLGLPKWQVTLRDVKSGATFLSYMTIEDGLNARTFIVYVFEHLIRHGIDVSKLTIQMDGASYAMNLFLLTKSQSLFSVSRINHSIVSRTWSQNAIS